MVPGASFHGANEFLPVHNRMAGTKGLNEVKITCPKALSMVIEVTKAHKGNRLCRETSN